MASMILMEITSLKKVGMSVSGGVQWLMRLAQPQPKPRLVERGLSPLYSGIILTLSRPSPAVRLHRNKEWQGFDGCETVGQRLHPPSRPIASLNSQLCKRHILANSGIDATIQRWIAPQVLAVLRFHQSLVKTHLQIDPDGGCIFFDHHSDNYLIGLQASPRHLLSLVAPGRDEEVSAKSVRNSSTFEWSLAKQTENTTLPRVLGAEKRPANAVSAAFCH